MERIGEGGSGALEPGIESIVRSIRRLETRVEELERRVAFAPQTAPAVDRDRPAPVRIEPEATAGLPVHVWVSLFGQACLVLCGAFLLRALTDRETLPRELGLTLGLVYAVAWLLVSERFARRGKTFSANFFGIASAVVAFPIVWESAMRFGVVAGPGSAALIGLVTLPALGLAWRRDLAPVAWAFGSGAVLACFALMFALHSVEPLAVPLLLVGLLTSWVARDGRWGPLHWPMAGAADLYVLHMTLLVGASDARLQWTRSPSAVVTLCLSLVLAYLAGIVVQTLWWRREVGAFECVQAGAALLVGLGGAARVAGVTHSGTAAIAASTLVAGVASYAVAFAMTRLRWQQRTNFLFYAWLAFALVFSGSLLLAERFVVVAAWCGLGVVFAILGARFRRVTLHYHAAAYLIAAAWVSDLASAVFGIFTLSADREWAPLRAPAVVVLSAAIAAYVASTLGPVDPRRPVSSRIPRLALALVLVSGAGGALVAATSKVMGNLPPDASPGIVAATRTAVLAVAAVALAATSRRAGALELRWIVYPLFLVGAVKLLIEDLRVSPPGALFVEFGLFGLSLIASQHLLRGGPMEDASAASLGRERDGPPET